MSSSSNCVDVIVPVFNGEATIIQAIESALCQKGRLINKIIVVDDGSRDATSRVVSDIESENIQLVRTINQGVASARNLGVCLSTAEWVAFLDADDLWDKDKLIIQMEAAEKFSAGFICGTVNGCPTRKTGPISAFSLWRGNFVATSSVLVKRDVLSRIAPVFRSDMKFAEDYLAWLKCLIVTRGCYAEPNLGTYSLSDRPRYNWPLILRNQKVLIADCARFSWRRGRRFSPIWLLPFCLMVGSVFSIMSILRRFINAR